MKHKESRILKALIIIDVKKGLTIEEIAKKYSKTNDYVYNVCNRNCVKPVSNIKQNYIKFTTFQILKELFDINTSMTDIGKKFNVSRQRIWNIYNDAKKAEIPGLPIR